MNKSTLVKKIAENCGLTISSASTVLDSFQKVTIDSLKQGESIKLTGFLTISTKQSKATTGRNPRTGESINIAPKVKPYIKAGKWLKDEVGTIKPKKDK